MKISFEQEVFEEMFIREYFKGSYESYDYAVRLVDHMLTAVERSEETVRCLNTIIDTLVTLRDSYKELSEEKNE